MEKIALRNEEGGTILEVRHLPGKPKRLALKSEVLMKVVHRRKLPLPKAICQMKRGSRQSPTCRNRKLADAICAAGHVREGGRYQTRLPRQVRERRGAVVMHAALAPTSPVSKEELQAVQDLRTILPELECLSDNYIIRWLRAKEFRFDETAEALKKHVVFRKAWELDTIADWQGPECLEKYCGYGILPDKDGRPILMSLLGNTDIDGLLKSVASLDYIKFSLAAIEKGLQFCETRAKQTGRPFEQMMLIFDLDHISSAHFSSKQFASSFTTLVKLFQEHYPMVLRKILIIRAPEMARLAYSSITAILAPSITRLIEMPSEADWKWALAQYVDLDSWPMHWGGRKQENGDPKCPSAIHYGIGPIPDNFFVDPRTAMTDYDQLTTVYAGDKHLISVEIKEPSKISWQYMTDEDDIGFQIYFDSTARAENLSEMETVYPYIRLECTNVPISDHFVAKKPGNYVLEFDNYYSWFAAKQLRYNIEIEEI